MYIYIYVMYMYIHLLVRIRLFRSLLKRSHRLSISPIKIGKSPSILFANRFDSLTKANKQTFISELSLPYLTSYPTQRFSNLTSFTELKLIIICYRNCFGRISQNSNRTVDLSSIIFNVSPNGECQKRVVILSKDTHMYINITDTSQ